jgi:hypothetical protein
VTASHIRKRERQTDREIIPTDSNHDKGNKVKERYGSEQQTNPFEYSQQ